MPYRPVGLKPSRMNPNCCTLWETAFTRVMKARAVTVDATVKSGEVLITSAVRDRSAGMAAGAGREFSLKGFVQPVTLFAA